MRWLVALLVAVGAGVLGASLTVPSSAAFVAGVSIPQSALNSDLSAISSNPGYQCYLDAQLALATQGQAQGFQLYGAGSSAVIGSTATYTNSFVRYWLNQMVSNEVIAAIAKQRSLRVTSADLAAARTETVDQIDGTFSQLAQSGIQPQCNESGAAIVAGLPAGFAREQVKNQALSDIVEANAGGYTLSQSSVEKFFEAHRSVFETICVTEAQLASSSAAGPIELKVSGGATLANAAPAGSSATGCLTPSQASYATINQATTGLKPGALTKVLQDQQGSYFLFQLNSRKPSNFSSVSGVARQVMLGTGRQKAAALLQATERRSHITIDPRYGRWLPASSTSGIFAPLSPPVASIPAVAKNQPSIAATAPALSQPGAQPGSGSGPNSSNGGG